MLVWIDLANSPHVPFFEPVVAALRKEGDEVVLTARRHAQTVALAERLWPDVTVVGGESPAGRARKGGAILGRAVELRKFARRHRPAVAISHGSYGQLVAAKTCGIASVTMMDYEYQPANHVSFRLADRVIVPDAFPEAMLRRFGAGRKKVRRYSGFKEELYLAGFAPDRAVLDELGIDASKTVVVFRPPPDGALYHRQANNRFDALLESALTDPEIEAVILPRVKEHALRYAHVSGAIVPGRPVDGKSLLCFADALVGAGGTMNREAALLGTPTYTLFRGRLAAVDAALIAAGRMFDLRDAESLPVIEKRRDRRRPVPEARRRAILEAIIASVHEVARRSVRPAGSVPRSPFRSAP